MTILPEAKVALGVVFVLGLLLAIGLLWPEGNGSNHSAQTQPSSKPTQSATERKQQAELPTVASVAPETPTAQPEVAPAAAVKQSEPESTPATPTAAETQPQEAQELRSCGPYPPNPGEGLLAISRKVYGAPELFPVIAEENHIKGPYYIVPNRTIMIPCREKLEQKDLDRAGAEYDEWETFLAQREVESKHEVEASNTEPKPVPIESSPAVVTEVPAEAATVAESEPAPTALFEVPVVMPEWINEMMPPVPGPEEDFFVSTPVMPVSIEVKVDVSTSNISPASEAELPRANPQPVSALVEEKDGIVFPKPGAPLCTKHGVCEFTLTAAETKAQMGGDAIPGWFPAVWLDQPIGAPNEEIWGKRYDTYARITTSSLEKNPRMPVRWTVSVRFEGSPSKTGKIFFQDGKNLHEIRASDFITRGTLQKHPRKPPQKFLKQQYAQLHIYYPKVPSRKTLAFQRIRPFGISVGLGCALGGLAGCLVGTLPVAKAILEQHFQPQASTVTPKLADILASHEQRIRELEEQLKTQIVSQQQ